MSLTHSTSFNNFWFIEPDHKLHIHFEPGTRYSYSGEGLILLQFVIEHGRKAHGLGLDVGDLTKANFERLGMSRTSLVWRDDFAANCADGWNDQGEPQDHDQRSKVRAAGSMDTTIFDLPKFAAALVRGDGLSAASRAEMTKPQLHITTAHQFPPFLPDLPVQEQLRLAPISCAKRPPIDRRRSVGKYSREAVKSPSLADYPSSCSTIRLPLSPQR